MDERLRTWRRQFPDQPFFSWLFVWTPNLLTAYEENPANIRKWVREFGRRAKEMAPPSEAERRLLEALRLLNDPANWLDQPSEIRNALLRLEQVDGEEWHGLRMLARQLFATFNGVQPDLRLFLPFLDRAMETCWNETERLAIAQSAIPALIAQQQWQEAITRLHQWLQLPGSDLYRRSLLLGWRNALTPLAADEKGREMLSPMMGLMPDDAFGWMLRAETWEVMGGTDKARQAYEQALQRSDADWLWQLCGEAALRWGNTELAERALKRAMGRAPDWERAMLWLQARAQREQLPDVAVLQRFIAHFGWRWQLLTIFAGIVHDPTDAFHLLRLAERLATMDAMASRLQKFLLRVNLARWAGQTGQRELAQFWLERLRQPEAPEEIRSAADEVAKQLP
jgi:tetratricopeptide (TPR) repeat protein